MTDDDARKITVAFGEAFAPMKHILEKIVTVLERQDARLEVLELEHLHQRDCTPIAPLNDRAQE